MAEPDAYLSNFGVSGRRVFQGALEESRRREQFYISPGHILYALLRSEISLFGSTIRHLSVDSSFVRSAVEALLEKSRRHTGEGFRISPETTRLFKYSMDKARSENRRVIEASDILYVLVTDKHSILNKITQNCG